MTWSPEQKAAARTAFVAGASVSEVSRRTGIPRSTLSEWAEREGWEAEREESQDYGRHVRAVKAKLLRGLRETDKPDPQEVFAWTRMESVYPEHRYHPATDPSARQRTALRVIEDLILHLGEEDPSALKALRPHLRTFMDRYREPDDA